MHPQSRVAAVLAATLIAALAATLPPVAAHAAPPDPSAPGQSAPATPGAENASVRVTLLTGDRVTVHPGAKVSVETRPGGAAVRFQTRRIDGRLHVIPTDALPLLRDGRLDRRLFDISTLIEFGYHDAQRHIPLIVTAAGTGARTAGARAAAVPAGTRAVRDLPAVGGHAVRADKASTATVWAGLTGTGTRSLRGGVAKVWLDGKRKPTLDASVPQIGAPTAWRAGFDGTGTTVAVLDSGIDASHRDLAGQVVGAENFTDGVEDNRDRVGHGTHVASTIAGTGAASAGRYRGVASGARLLDGKVCVSGGCDESWILAGMQWAAEKGADVVNMSLSGRDTADTDPLEQAVDDLSARYGTLFVVAAGNAGPRAASVGSPASAAAALAVGAVSKTDEPADFSSRGPRVGDDGIKPEITAPGVDIVAARSADGWLDEPAPLPGYTTLSGTSMAAPHVAGAAAIIAQQHPDWTPQQLKATLMASAKAADGVSVLAQGAGRVDLSRAINQTVTSEPSSVTFGRQLWPHQDDAAVSRTVTYRNGGTAAVTLALNLRATGPDGKAAPAGVFALSASSVTVPAGGQATVTMTADTRVQGPDGAYTGHLEATAGGTVVRTPFGVNREVESYDVTMVHTGRDGQAPDLFITTLLDLDSLTAIEVFDTDATTTVRVPKGTYGAVSYLVTEGASGEPADAEQTMLAQPRLTVDRALRLGLDARLGRPISVGVPRRDATPVLVDVTAAFTGKDFSASFGTLSETFDGLFTGQLGPQASAPGFASQLGVTLAKVDGDGRLHNSPFAYHLAWQWPGRMFTGFTRRIGDRQLATVNGTYARQAAEGYGVKFNFSVFPDNGGGWAVAKTFDLPSRHTEYVNTDGAVRWRGEFTEERPAASEDQLPDRLAGATNPAQSYRAGRTYAQRWNQAVFGPSVASPDWPETWASRTGDTILAAVPLFADGAGRPGGSGTDRVRTALYRDGTKVGESAEPFGEFAVPPGRAAYRLEMSAERGAPHVLSTRVEATWTFRSAHVAGDAAKRLPLSTVRFTPPVDELNTAPAGRTLGVAVTVVKHPGSGAVGNRSLQIEVSYDDGRSWQRAALRPGPTGSREAVLHHPAAAGFVSLRATATDSAGATVTQTVIRAYRTR